MKPVPRLPPPPLAKQQHWLGVGGEPEAQATTPKLPPKVEGLPEPRSARPQPNWKIPPRNRKDGAPVVGGYPKSMYVAKAKEIHILVPPPKPGQPQAAVPGQLQAAEAMPTVPENQVAKPPGVPLDDGPRFYTNPLGQMVNAKGERVDEFGRVTHARWVPGQNRPSRNNWLARRHKGDDKGKGGGKGGGQGGQGRAAGAPF